MSFKSGFVALIGRPNAGKSTLVNQIMQDKIAIVSNKAQTTRNMIRAILTEEDSQIIFIDTPGIHKPQNEMGKQLNRLAFSALEGVDLIYFLVDVTKTFGKGDQFVLEICKRQNLPIYLILNKIDLLSKKVLIEKLMEYENLHLFDEIIPISALRNDNIDHLLKITKDLLPISEALYPKDMITEFPEQFFITEWIREQILQTTSEEIPHSIAVLLDEYKEDKNSIFIQASIVVERDSQKAIIIGKNGQKLKSIGQAARENLEKRLKKPIYLDLFVKVEKNWRNSQNKLNAFSLNTTGQKFDE
ncbi:MAG: GTPase Era [Erysipelotrichaceae bacterium]